MNINLEKAKDDLEVLDSQVISMTEEIDRLNEELAELRTKRAYLESFIRLCEHYTEPQQYVDKVTVVHEGNRPTKRTPAAPPKLDRDPAKQQTKIAIALAQKFQPGDILTSHSAADTASHVITDTKGLMPQHYIVNYISREAHAVNGIVERVDRGQWRMRDNALVRATTPPT